MGDETRPHIGKKAQAFSFDFASSTLALIFIIVIVIGVILSVQAQQGQPSSDFEVEYAFSNLETNLMHDPSPGIAFLSGNRVSKAELDAYVAAYQAGIGGDPDFLDRYIIGAVSPGHGIGLDPAAYDTCLYFTDKDGIVELASGFHVLGVTSAPCQDTVPASKNPCQGYKQATALIKPVLLDTGDPAKNRIIQMAIVMCKR